MANYSCLENPNTGIRYLTFQPKP